MKNEIILIICILVVLVFIFGIIKITFMHIDKKAKTIMHKNLNQNIIGQFSFENSTDEWKLMTDFHKSKDSNPVRFKIKS